ncbi:hypothetical protein F9Z39_1021 [Neisseria gonorrhoeae]|nr:hypothetical protein F9Z39_1021 [Neisseria gonorrhoeae]
MTRYAINRDALYSAFKDFLYSEINANPALKSATVDDLADIVLAKKWRIFCLTASNAQQPKKLPNGFCT